MPDVEDADISPDECTQVVSFLRSAGPLLSYNRAGHIKDRTVRLLGGV
jgi:hypothetical protein